MWLGLTVAFFLLRAVNAIHSVPLCFFLSAVAGAFCFSIDQLRSVSAARPLLRLRQVVLVVVIVAIPSLFDPATVEIDNLPRLVVLVVAAVLIVGIWAVDAVWSGWRPRRLVNGFQWILLAIVVWFGVTTLASVEPRASFLGRYGSYEGFLLIAALAVLATALAESFKAEALPALFRMVVVASVPVLVYGVIQVYGFDVDKHSPWDFVDWHNAYHNVFSTLGNPNHMGAFLDVVLPLGVVSAVLVKNRWQRAALWGWVAVTVVLLLQTAARGAWLGALAGGAILVVGLLPRLRAKARTVSLIAGAGLIAVVALVGAGSHFLGGKASFLFKFGSGSSVAQRYGYWAAALHLGTHHPLVGTGPDTYAVTYAQYQSAGLAKELGGAFFVNGAHNIFLSWLANEGIPGLLLIVALLVLGVVLGTRAWMSLRADAGPATPEDDTAPREARRYMVAGLVAAFVGFFVQASFNVEQVATLFMLFVVLGLLGTVNRSIWPTAALLHPAFAFRKWEPQPDVPTAEEDSEYPALVARSGTYGRSATQARQDLRRVAIALAVGAVALTALGLTFWRTDAMWRADHAAHIRTQASLVKATELNPWEPSYFVTIGQAAYSTYSQAPAAPTALGYAQAAVRYLQQAEALDPSNEINQFQYGQALATEAKLEHSDRTMLQTALAALQRAHRENPYDPQVAPLIKQVQRSLGIA